MIASADIAKTVYKHERFKVIVQTGMGWTPKIAQSTKVFNIPAQLSCNFGKKEWFFESGVGATYLLKSRLHRAIDQEASNELYLSPVVGFRHEAKRWFGRVYACPLFLVSDKHLYDEVTTDFLKFGVTVGTVL